MRRSLTTHVLKGHTREIIDVKISGDGRRVVSLSRDRTLRAWDLETGRATRALVSQDDERALASLNVNTAMIAELETSLIVDRSARPIPRDPTMEISPDGAHVMLGSQGNVCTWNLVTGASQHQELGELDIVAIEIGPDCRRSVLGSLFGPVLLCQHGEAPLMLEGHSGRSPGHCPDAGWPPCSKRRKRRYDTNLGPRFLQGGTTPRRMWRTSGRRRHRAQWQCCLLDLWSYAGGIRSGFLRSRGQHHLRSPDHDHRSNSYRHASRSRRSLRSSAFPVIAELLTTCSSKFSEMWATLSPVAALTRLAQFGALAGFFLASAP